MEIERLGNEGWEITERKLFTALILSSKASKVRTTKDTEYCYIVFLYEGVPQVYRMKKEDIYD